MSEPLDEQVIRKIMTDKLKSAYYLQKMSKNLFVKYFMKNYPNARLQKNTEFRRLQYIRKVKILEKLKKNDENLKFLVINPLTFRHGK